MIRSNENVLMKTDNWCVYFIFFLLSLAQCLLKTTEESPTKFSRFLIKALISKES